MRLLLILVLCAIVFVTGYILGHDKNPETLQETLELNQQPEIANISPVTNYLKYSAGHEWSNLLTLLSGEALLNARYNIDGFQLKNEGTLMEHKVVNFAPMDGYSIAEVKAVTITLTDKGDEFQLLNYRFFLEGEKIFKVERLKEIREHEFVICSDLDIQAEKTVLEYFQLIEKNNWQKALELLTGEAKETAQKSLNRMPNLPGLNFNNIELKTAGSVDRTVYIEAVYHTGELNIKALFALDNIHGKWYIGEITIVDVNEKFFI